jgi:hypothetical protein
MADLATQWPADPEGSAVNFKVNTPTQVSETFSGKIRRVGLGVSYYSWEIRYSNLTPLQAGTVNGYSAQALGQQFSFEIILPEISYSKAPNQTTTTPTISANLAVGATSITLTNCGATKNVLAAGDFFKFQNFGNTKVYMCVSPCISDSSGNATLFFSGPCVLAAPSGTQVKITAVPFTAILDEEAQEWEVGFGGITNLSVAMREVY